MNLISVESHRCETWNEFLRRAEKQTKLKRFVLLCTWALSLFLSSSWQKLHPSRLLWGGLTKVCRWKPNGTRTHLAFFTISPLFNNEPFCCFFFAHVHLDRLCTTALAQSTLRRLGILIRVLSISPTQRQQWCRSSPPNGYLRVF